MSDRKSICAPEEKPVATLPLSRGLVAIVDAADFASVGQFKWSAAKRGKTWYAVRRKRMLDGKIVVVYLHRELFPGVPRLDHRNGNGLDNRRHNLRPANAAQNIWNTSAPAKPKTSRFKGVHRSKAGRWISQIRANNKVHTVGSFDTEEEAAVAYEAAAQRLHGEFARVS